jgi:hypothetical protein
MAGATRLLEAEARAANRRAEELEAQLETAFTILEMLRNQLDIEITDDLFIVFVSPDGSRRCPFVEQVRARIAKERR